MPYDTKAAAVTPPMAGKNIIVLPSAAATARLKFPASWRRSVVTIQADGVDVYVAFGDTAVTAVIAADTNLTAEAPASHDTGICFKIPSGQQRDFDLALINVKNPGSANEQNNLRMAHIESGTGGFIRILRSSGPVDDNDTGI